LKLSDIIAIQPKAWSILSRSYGAGRIASTYLFAGPYGAGHWPLAVALAALLNCESPVVEAFEANGDLTVPCGGCRACRAVWGLNFEGLYPIVPIPSFKNSSEAVDLTNEVLQAYRAEPMRVPGASSPITIPIDQAREVKQSLSRRGGEGVHRVVIFDRMEKMKTSSADALLKLIEEPPPNTTIILIAARPESLLPTVQSRSQKIRLQRTSEQAVRAFLESNYELPEKRALLLARLAEGLPGAAVALLHDDDEEETGGRSLSWLLFKTVFTKPEAEAVYVVTDLFDRAKRGDVEEMLAFWQRLIRDCAWVASTGELDGVTNIDFMADMQQFAPLFAVPGVTARLTAHIKNTLADLVYNVHIQTALSALVLNMGETLRAAREKGQSTVSA
jgi:DNA polymerase-3 subunit delta'